MGVLGIYWGVSGLRKKLNSSENRKNHVYRYGSDQNPLNNTSSCHDDHDNQIHSLRRDVFRLAQPVALINGNTSN